MKFYSLLMVKKIRKMLLEKKKNYKKNDTELDQIKKLLSNYTCSNDTKILKISYNNNNNIEKYAGMIKSPSASKLPIPYKLLNYEVI